MLNSQKKRIEPDIVVLEIAGRICLGRECQQLEWQVEDLLRANEKKVIFDLSGVNHIDSTGIGILAMCSGKLKKAGGELRVAGASGLVDEVLKMTKMDSILGLYPTAAAAAEGFTDHPA